MIRDTSTGPSPERTPMGRHGPLTLAPGGRHAEPPSPVLSPVHTFRPRGSTPVPPPRRRGPVPALSRAPGRTDESRAPGPGPRTTPRNVWCSASSPANECRADAHDCLVRTGSNSRPPKPRAEESAAWAVWRPPGNRLSTTAGGPPMIGAGVWSGPRAAGRGPNRYLHHSRAAGRGRAMNTCRTSC